MLKPSVNSVSRRSVMRGVAWSVPAVLVAAEAPAYAASLSVACAATPHGWSQDTDFTLFHDGRAGFKAGTNQQGAEAYPDVAVDPSSESFDPNASAGAWPIFTTGFTPGVAGDGSHPAEAWAELPGALTRQEITGQTWGFLDGLEDATGFLSMDDRDNTNGDEAPVSVHVDYELQLTPGATFDLNLPMRFGDDYLGTQSVAVSVSGADVLSDPIRVYVGAVDQCVIPDAALDGYDAAPAATDGRQYADTSYLLSLVPTGTGAVTVTFTFTLFYVSSDEGQNADIWIGQPTLAGCVD